MRYDVAIIGSGPAGLAAAINAKVRNKNLILFGSADISAKLRKAPKIENYLGFVKTTGDELADTFKQHIDSMGIEITEKKVTNVYSMGDYFSLLVEGNMIEATTVVLSTGVEFSKPLKGEEEFLGRGVGYRATCDAAAAAQNPGGRAPAFRPSPLQTVCCYLGHSDSDRNMEQEFVEKLKCRQLIRLFQACK